MVRDVEKLKSQLDLLRFLDIETPAYRGINIKIRRPEQRIRPQVAKMDGAQASLTHAFRMRPPQASPPPISAT
jgi:hypothetical protein